MRLALILNAIHPAIGGVLIRGEKGTAKSTVVRALAELLPAVEVRADCRFACLPEVPAADCPDCGPPADSAEVHDTGANGSGANDSGSNGPGAGGALRRAARLVELPVAATEDRVVGSLDLERALTEGKRAFQPGLLAEAHRGVLYVDEVNLLHDHVVDLLLDAAAMGRVHVERDGVSVSHAASFLLVGTMNPEEGELRPQLLDRFGLTVTVAADRDVARRTEVIRRRLAYEADPASFAADWRSADADLATRILRAQQRLADVVLPDSELRRIAAVCAAFDVDGMRADLVVARTAIAHAAWRGGTEVLEDDVAAAARLALPHRRRRDPFDEPGIDDDQLSDALRQAAEDADSADPGSDQATDQQSDDSPPEDPHDPDDDPGGGAKGDTAEDTQAGEQGSRNGQSTPEQRGSAGDRQAPSPEQPFRARLLSVPGTGEGAPGRRSRARGPGGRIVRAAREEGTGLHLTATIAAAAPHQHDRGRTGPGLLLRAGDLRRAVREGKESNLVLFAVDASGSMAARARMSAVTGAVLSLLTDAYQRRDKVGVVTFRGTGAETALPPTSSVDAAVRRLRELRTGGRTPLADGLLRARKVLQVERVRDPRRRALLVLLTDGRATASVRGGDPMQDARRAAAALAGDGVAAIVVDCEEGSVRLGLAGQLANELDASCLRLGELSAEHVAGVVRHARAA
ncbi:magnesium chelatase subunit D family protein [Tamaricihabitans halophyticus]